MAHKIETTAWTNEKPWHGLGVKVAPTLTSDQMLKAAGLDWTVHKKEIKTVEGKLIPGFFALERSRDEKILDIVGGQYTPIQNHEAFKFFKEFVEAGKAKMDTAGSLKGGRMVWGLASLGQGFKIKGKDEIKGYLGLACPHEQGKAFRIFFTCIRVVCNNTLTMALNAAKADEMFTMAHRKSFDDDMIMTAKETLGCANDTFDEFKEISEKLASKKLSEADAHNYLRQVFISQDAEVEVLENKPFSYAVQALKLAPGQNLLTADGTAWGAFNAVTYTTDHLLGRSNDTRLQKAWFGRTATLKAKALKLAQEI